MTLLEAMLADRLRRVRLIGVISEIEPQVASIQKIRFCIAVGEYERLRDKVMRKSKGRKIMAMFFQEGAMFQLSGVPERIRESVLTENNYEAYDQLRSDYIQELSVDPVVMNAVKQVDLISDCGGDDDLEFQTSALTQL